ncbi:hypothetical protein, partial [Sinorhizobium glycinis]|uniref:hypothetical protein n=1 Tax=Sinorhizobium glycinis TaxID=1472378 RepID=UPI001A7E0E76
WSPFVLSKQTESQLADFTQLFFGQALIKASIGARSLTGARRSNGAPCRTSSVSWNGWLVT